MISLSDLKALRAAMTEGEYHAWGTVITAREPTPDCLNESALIGTADSSDATGIVATHNAADCLIEIAEAALAYEQARDAFNESAARDDRPVFEGKRWAMDARHRELRAALAKIKP